MAAFSTLWAVAHLVHVARHPSATDPFVLATTVAAAAVIARPSSRARLAFLATTQLALLWRELPLPMNHFLIMGLVNLVLLFTIVTTRRDDDHLARSVPGIQVVAVISYGAAAIAKLNAGFFSADSCAPSLFLDTLAIVGGPTPPTWAMGMLAPAVAAIEIAIAVMLLVPRARAAAAATAVVFHLAISVSPTATAGLGFTVALMALLVVFLPDQDRVALTARLDQVGQRFSTSDVRLHRLVGVALIGYLSLIATGHAPFARLVGPSPNWVYVAPVAIVIGTLLLDAVRTGARERSASSPRPREVRRPSYATVAIAIVTGAMTLAVAAGPYLGTRTIASFAMYSNLDTTNGSNHWFLPSRIGGGHNDLVEVVDTSHVDLWLATRQQRQLSYHELRRHLVAEPAASITFRRGGEEVALARASDRPDLVRARPIVDRLVVHRVHVPDAAPCRW